MLRYPLITLALALLGGAAVGQAKPAALGAQEALCSYGSETLCREIRTCVERSWSIGLRNGTFGFGQCNSWQVDMLYFKDGIVGGTPSGEEGEDKDPGDETGGDENQY